MYYSPQNLPFAPEIGWLEDDSFGKAYFHWRTVSLKETIYPRNHQ